MTHEIGCSHQGKGSRSCTANGEKMNEDVLRYAAINLSRSSAYIGLRNQNAYATLLTPCNANAGIYVQPMLSK
jgi:hypothetical protein